VNSLLVKSHVHYLKNIQIVSWDSPFGRCVDPTAEVEDIEAWIRLGFMIPALLSLKKIEILLPLGLLLSSEECEDFTLHEDM
jgi:hypothetical protein